MSKFLTLYFLLFLATLRAQPTFPLTAVARAEVVDSIANELIANYVFPDTAALMAAHIRKRLKSGAYDPITSPADFSDALTTDLYAIHRDPHLLVQYAPSPPAATVDSSPPPDPFKRITDANFGLRKVEVLDGNIGYLNIRNFWADQVHGKATVWAALQFIVHTNALIIDLRGCGGGSQETVRMICGPFLAHSTHINDVVDRTTDSTTAFWTVPDSTLSPLISMPLYILIGDKTFSAGEEFAYDLQSLGRARIVGERSGGGAHGTYGKEVGHGFVLSIPYCTSINPTTGTNWEGSGVRPDVAIAADNALEEAEMMVFDSLLAHTTDKHQRFKLQWDRDMLHAITDPMTLDAATLAEYAGVYGARTFTVEDGKLFYQRAGRPKFELEAMSSMVMKGKWNTYFKIEFLRDPDGRVDQVKADYQDERTEISQRTKQ